MNLKEIMLYINENHSQLIIFTYSGKSYDKNNLYTDYKCES